MSTQTESTNRCGLDRDSSLPSFNFSIILTLSHIANLIEYVVCFISSKDCRCSCIVTEPRTDRFLLLGGLTVTLHHALDVGDFRRGKD